VATQSEAEAYRNPLNPRYDLPTEKHSFQHVFCKAASRMSERFPRRKRIKWIELETPFQTKTTQY